MSLQNLAYETKQLIVEVKENRDKYISGELDLNVSLDQTERLYQKSSEGEPEVRKVLQDSDLLKLQTEIAKESARFFQIDNLVFDEGSFCEKVKNRLCPNEIEDSGDEPSISRGRRSATTKVWKELGERSKILMNTVPTFSFIYGTFDADPVVLVPKERRQVIRDKPAVETRPLQVTPGSDQNEQDVMLRDAQRVYTIFNEVLKISKKNVICFFEFVTDPGSFTRTVENIFLVSLLVKDGYVCICSDDQGLPCLKKMRSPEKNNWPIETAAQSVLTMSYDDWKDIVKTFKFRKPVIPPRTT